METFGHARQNRSMAETPDTPPESKTRRAVLRAAQIIESDPATEHTLAALRHIRWATGETRYGRVIVGATERGVCCVLFWDGGDPAETLQVEFPRAELVRDDDARGRLGEVIATIEGVQTGAELPLHLLGTPFQREVWAELRRIPPGETASYAEVARRIGRPRAVRAVASACAGNHAAVVVPCHRVVRSDGGLGGYKWGEERKGVLIAEEKRRDGAS